MFYLEALESQRSIPYFCWFGWLPKDVTPIFLFSSYHSLPILFSFFGSLFHFSLELSFNFFSPLHVVPKSPRWTIGTLLTKRLDFYEQSAENPRAQHAPSFVKYVA